VEGVVESWSFPVCLQTLSVLVFDLTLFFWLSLRSRAFQLAGRPWVVLGSGRGPSLHRVTTFSKAGGEQRQQCLLMLHVSGVCTAFGPHVLWHDFLPLFPVSPSLLWFSGG
jgi:hypothetical protein